MMPLDCTECFHLVVCEYANNAHRTLFHCPHFKPKCQREVEGKICKECIHCEICKGNPNLPLFDENQEALCKAFKPKSRFVELPCDFCKIIVTGTAENPYYQLLYYQNRTNSWHIGYSSYDLANVFRWKQELEEAEKALAERSKE